MAGHRFSAIYCDDPRAAYPRRVMPDVLKMTARQLSEYR
jgi:hypothetical protein